jgi:predicted MPP superfamily phosphohydrolase
MGRERHRRDSSMKRAAFAFLSAAVILLLLAGWGVLNARATPIMRTARIELPGWRPDASDITVALLADIHLGNIGMDQGRLRSIVDQVNERRPDLVAVAGDLIVGHAPADAKDLAAPVSEELARLDAPLGVLVVFGNHEYWTAPGEIREALTAKGLVVLENASTQRGPITVVGVSDAFSEHDDVDRALAGTTVESDPLVVLTHTPDIAPRLPASVQLVLAGHTHCGQIVILLLDRGGDPRSPKAGWKPLYNPHYRCGLIQDPDRSVIVTAGLGPGTARVRFGAPPDWWLITLGPVRDE